MDTKLVKRLLSKRAAARRYSLLFAMLIAALLPARTALAQQTDVPRYDVFTGWAYLNSPGMGLAENGFHFQIGVRAKKWVSLGFDYSRASGDATLKPDMLVTSLQQTLGAQLAALAAAGRLPAGYALQVPTQFRSQTFTVGPQLAYRRIKFMTLFLRPSIGLMRAVAKPEPADAIARGVIGQLAATGLLPASGEKKEWKMYYGFGGGLDFLFNRTFALRVQADLVQTHLYSDLLQNKQGVARFSIGPAFNFGKNIAE